MRHHVIGILATLTAAFAAQSSVVSRAEAQSPGQRPDFVGVWKMDTTKFAKRDAELSALTLTVGLRGDTLVIVTDVVDAGRPPTQMRSQYAPAKPVSQGEAAGSALSSGSLTWQGDTLVLRRVEQRPDRTLQIEERWALDGTGRTLSRYQKVNDVGVHLSQQTLVFTRQ